MPPEDEPQPTQAEREVITAWVTSQLAGQLYLSGRQAEANLLRRLTRYEYNNTLRDLLTLDLNFAEDLPPEGAAHEGFGQ